VKNFKNILLGGAAALMLSGGLAPALAFTLQDEVDLDCPFFPNTGERDTIIDGAPETMRCATQAEINDYVACRQKHGPNAICGNGNW
jgi:hypothetical protein